MNEILEIMNTEST